MLKTKFTKKKIIQFCDRALYWLVVGMPFAGSFSSAFLHILLGWACFLYLLKKILLKDYRPAKTAINMPFLFLIIISAVSIFNSIDLLSSMQGLFKLFKYGFLFLIFYESVVDIRHLKKIAMAIGFGVLLVSLDGIWQLYFGKDFLRYHTYDYVLGLPRLKASFPHTNLFGLYLGLVLPLIFALGRYFFKNRQKFLFTLIGICAFYCLIFTFSRGSIIGFIVALIIIAFMQKDRLLIGLIIISILAAPFLLPSSIRDWAKERSSVWELMFNAERIYIYKTTFNMIKQHPFIGVGVNTFCENYTHYKVNDSYGNTGESRYYGHNNFLHMAGEIGFIGLGIFLWLLFTVFKKWHIFYKLSPTRSFLSIFSLGLVAGIAGFLINGISETGLYYSKTATLFWVQIGILLGFFKVSGDYNNQDTQR
jgi:O-antigen ligase